MNLQPSSSENKKYTVKTSKTVKSGGRSREDFAKGFLQAYDGALKSIVSGKNRGRKAREVVSEMMKYVEENEHEKT